ncbi:MAG: UPF0104 family protein [Rhodospirillaceae bacterium]|nr:UPF0104 family protein [Rhodospirillaceae bacterium]
MSGWKWARPAIAVGVLTLAVFLLQRTFRSYDASEIMASVRSISALRFAAIAACAFASYLCLTGFDALGVRYAGGCIAYRRIARVSMTSLSLGHSIGFAALSSGAIRYRLYSRLGLGLEQVAKVVLLCAVTVALGLSAILSTGFLMRPEIAERIGGLGPREVLGLGILAGAVPLTYLLLAVTVKGRLKVRQWTFRMPPPGIALAQVLIGPLNFACVAACLYAALSDRTTIDYLDVLAAYALANTASLLAHVPGGLGVIESVVAFLLPGADVVGALIVFRVVYYLIPFVLGAASFALSELARRSTSGVQERGSAVLARFRR